MPFTKGYIPWNVGKGSAPQIGNALKGKEMPYVAQKNSRMTGEMSRRWVGDAITYGPLHAWVRKCLGTPSICSHCLKTDRKRYEWANISGDYRRELDDWIRLCRSCHIAFDKAHGRWGVARRRIALS